MEDQARLPKEVEREPASDRGGSGGIGSVDEAFEVVGGKGGLVVAKGARCGGGALYAASDGYVFGEVPEGGPSGRTGTSPATKGLRGSPGKSSVTAPCRARKARW